MDSITDNYLNVQQDILETFVDRHQLKALTAPTLLPGGKRIPGLTRPSSPAGSDARAGALRQCSGFQQLPHFRSSCSRCRGFGLHPIAVSPFFVALRSIRAQSQKGLSKFLTQVVTGCFLRATPSAWCSLNSFERIYAPLTAGLLCPSMPIPSWATPPPSQLDRLYARVASSLDNLLQAIGLKKAA